MFQPITRAAYRLDEWLHHRLGRPYRVALSVGLMVDIVHRITGAPKAVAEHHGWIGLILGTAMELGLLVHQLAEMYERLGGKRKAEGGEGEAA